MTPAALRARLPEGRWPDDPARLLRVLEARAEARPQDRALDALVEAAHLQLTAGDGLPAVVAGVRPEALVRWDAWSSTWDGIRVVTGERARVRVLRASVRGQPAWSRALVRAGRALEGLAPVAIHRGPWPALVAPLPGVPLVEGGERPVSALVRLAVTGLARLTAWERAGLGLGDAGSHEWCDAGDTLVRVGLTPVSAGDAGPSLRALVEGLVDHDGETEVHALLRGLVALPPRTAGAAAISLQHALGSHLAGVRHQVAARADRLAASDRRGRLSRLATRLAEAVPPPVGRGVIGVDLDGQPVVLEGRQGGLWLGSPDAVTTALYTPEGGVVPRPARRALRIRGAAPLKEWLQRSVDGDTAFADAATRWLAGRLSLRTVRMLLDR